MPVKKQKDIGLSWRLYTPLRHSTNSSEIAKYIYLPATNMRPKPVPTRSTFMWIGFIMILWIPNSWIYVTETLFLRRCIFLIVVPYLLGGPNHPWAFYPKSKSVVLKVRRGDIYPNSKSSFSASKILLYSIACEDATLLVVFKRRRDVKLIGYSLRVSF